MVNYECYECFETKEEQDIILAYNDKDLQLIPLCKPCYNKNKAETTTPEDDEEEDNE